MSKGQKLVKFFAIILAITLIISIVSFALTLIFSVLHIINIKDASEITNKEVVNVYSEDLLDNLELDVISANVFVKEGEKFQVTTNSKYISLRQVEDTFLIQEEEHIIKDNASVTICIPKDFDFKEVEINIGAGELEIEVLNANRLEFNLGAGNTNIYDINVEEAIIDTGAGTLNISSGIIDKLKLDTGVGDVTLSLNILEDADIDAGIGNLELTLLGKEELYTLDISKGLGNITIDDMIMTLDTVIGNGNINIKITGGIGNIDVNFLELI